MHMHYLFSMCPCTLFLSVSNVLPVSSTCHAVETPGRAVYKLDWLFLSLGECLAKENYSLPHSHPGQARRGELEKYEGQPLPHPHLKHNFCTRGCEEGSIFVEHQSSMPAGHSPAGDLWVVSTLLALSSAKGIEQGRESTSILILAH